MIRFFHWQWNYLSLTKGDQSSGESGAHGLNPPTHSVTIVRSHLQWAVQCQHEGPQAVSVAASWVNTTGWDELVRRQMELRHKLIHILPIHTCSWASEQHPLHPFFHRKQRFLFLLPAWLSGSTCVRVCVSIYVHLWKYSYCWCPVVSVCISKINEPLW